MTNSALNNVVIASPQGVAIQKIYAICAAHFIYWIASLITHGNYISAGPDYVRNDNGVNTDDGLQMSFPPLHE